jgi:hypothetical protein
MARADEAGKGGEVSDTNHPGISIWRGGFVCLACGRAEHLASELIMRDGERMAQEAIEQHRNCPAHFSQFTATSIVGLVEPAKDAP